MAKDRELLNVLPGPAMQGDRERVLVADVRADFSSLRLREVIQLPRAGDFVRSAASSMRRSSAGCASRSRCTQRFFSGWIWMKL